MALNSNRSYGFETLSFHAGQETADSATGARAVPIYQTSSFVFDSPEHAANLFGLKQFGNIYTRIMNPTQDAFERRIAALEGGVGALATRRVRPLRPWPFSISPKLATKLSPRPACMVAHIICSTILCPKWASPYVLSIAATPKISAPPSMSARRRSMPRPLAIRAWTRWTSAPSRDIAHEHGLPLIIDNTLPTPYLVQPLKHGADIVVHSATKFIGGHGTSIGGVIVDGGTFDWAPADASPAWSSPIRPIMACAIVEALGPMAYIIKARVQLLRDLGPAIAPFNSWLFLQGLETLPLRMERHSQNALRVAQFLEGHPAVDWVSYPGLASHPQHELAAKYFTHGYGAILGFGIKGGLEAGKQLIRHMELFSHLANVGDAKSLIIHPASTTHSQLTPEEQFETGVTPDFIRLSIGLETVDDLIDDLDQALRAAVASVGESVNV